MRMTTTGTISVPPPPLTSCSEYSELKILAMICFKVFKRYIICWKQNNASYNFTSRLYADMDTINKDAFLDQTKKNNNHTVPFKKKNQVSTFLGDNAFIQKNCFDLKFLSYFLQFLYISFRCGWGDQHLRWFGELQNLWKLVCLQQFYNGFHSPGIKVCFNTTLFVWQIYQKQLNRRFTVRRSDDLNFKLQFLFLNSFPFGREIPQNNA